MINFCKNIFKYTFSITLIYLLVAFLFSAFNYTINFPVDSNIPKIGKNLPSNHLSAMEQFHDRIREAFPNGSSSNAAKKDLESQGFQIIYDHENKKVIASFFQKAFPCSQLWAVNWREDNNNDIVNIGSEYLKNVCNDYLLKAEFYRKFSGILSTFNWNISLSIGLHYHWIRAFALCLPFLLIIFPFITINHTFFRSKKIKNLGVKLRLALMPLYWTLIAIVGAIIHNYAYIFRDYNSDTLLIGFNIIGFMYILQLPLLVYFNNNFRSFTIIYFFINLYFVNFMLSQIMSKIYYGL